MVHVLEILRDGGAWKGRRRLLDRVARQGRIRLRESGRDTDGAGYARGAYEPVH